MLCRFVFGFWWSAFVAGVWYHLRQPMHVWTVDRHNTQRIHVTKSFQPIEFKNASVLWIDNLKDSVHLELQNTMPEQAVEIADAKMYVYENCIRDTVMEVYDLQLGGSNVADAHLNLVQDDCHLSPFRRIEILPKLTFNMTSDKEPDLYRAGYFKNGKWYEGGDTAQMGFGTLFAWCMGVVFLVVMRRPQNDSTIVVKREKRIFKEPLLY